MEENKFKDTQVPNDTPAADTAPGSAAADSFKWDYAGQDEYNRKRQKKESRRSGLFYTLVALLVFSVAFISIGAVALLDSYTNITQIIERENTVYIREDNTAALTVSEIASKIKPSVVVIDTMSELSNSAGSGFIISEDGYIATNFHVAGDSAVLKVTLYDGSEYDAQYIGGDELSDIALIKIDAKGLTPVETGDSSALVVGEDVVAIGNPSGSDYRNTVTNGIVSYVERKVKVYGDDGKLEKTMTLIQTNAALNHGNSGGPLINSRGQVIGINVIRLESGYTGIGFALPINESLGILDEIKAAGKDLVRNSTPIAYRNAVIGITGKVVSDKIDSPVSGIRVEAIEEGFDAQKKGVLVGDIIVAINGEAVGSISGFREKLEGLRADDPVTLRIYRDGEYLEISVKLGYVEK